jgi:glycosyltransferase involved in cell wall biosynthesis
MGAELPIITTSVGCEGIPIQNERDCLIANTAEELHQAMVGFTELPDDGKALSDSSLKIAMNQFSWDVISRQTVELYESL